MPKYERFQFGEQEKGKLVRDLVVPQCINEGCHPHTRQVSGTELEAFLIIKLGEEREEVILAADRKEKVSELGDLREVILALESLHSTSPVVTEARQFWSDSLAEEFILEPEVEAARLKKLERKGGFKDGIVVFHNDIPAGHEDIPVFRSQPEKYRYLGEFTY